MALAPVTEDAFRAFSKAVFADDALEDNPGAVSRCLEWRRRGSVVPLFAAKDRERNQAVVLRDHLRALMGKELMGKEEPQ